MTGSIPPPSRRLILLRLHPDDPSTPVVAEVGPVGVSTRCASMGDVLRVFGADQGPGITLDGARVPPIEGDTPCAEYDPAGIGAGVEEDGAPQCATCGFSLAEHEGADAGPPSGVFVADPLFQECHICEASPGDPCNAEIHARHSRGEPPS